MRPWKPWKKEAFPELWFLVLRTDSHGNLGIKGKNCERVRVPSPQLRESSGRCPSFCPGSPVAAAGKNFPLHTTELSFPHYTEWKTEVRLEGIRMSLCPDYSPALAQGGHTYSVFSLERGDLEWRHQDSRKLRVPQEDRNRKEASQGSKADSLASQRQ